MLTIEQTTYLTEILLEEYRELYPQEVFVLNLVVNKIIK